MRQMTLALLVLAATTTGALAHSKAEQTTPANEATVAEVDAIEMRFDDPMRVTAITLTGPDGDINRAYTVDWRGLSSDGHPMQGTFSFTIAD